MAHIHDKIDFTASAFVVFDNKVLLHKHKKTGLWLQPGGHIELDEDPNEAVLREVREETGLEVELMGESDHTTYAEQGKRELVLPRFLNRHFFDKTRTHEHIDMVYFARAKSAQLISEGGVEIGWYTREEISDPAFDLLPDIRKYALMALEELSS
ncbi:MAG: hydrolase [Candidatus Kaiserbacteria bacterium]|nr:hydrolase [Candidatus Kaiserbacteria bacterium]